MDQGISDESAEEGGYDSENAEASRSERRGVKRRKLSQSSEDSANEVDIATKKHAPTSKVAEDEALDSDVESLSAAEDEQDAAGHELDYKFKSATTTTKRASKKPKKERRPGVVYLSSLPPYLKPSALRNILGQRGFEPITRLFLAPSSKHKHSSKKSSRQLYSEGWIEFESKKMAKRCAEALNAQLLGGKKGGFYYDDLWNMKYLKGMAWDELMAGIREERREEEGRRDEERRKIAAETKFYVEGVERGKRLEGIRKKRMRKDGNVDQDDDVQRTWRQHEVLKDATKGKKHSNQLDPQVQSVLSKII